MLFAKAYLVFSAIATVMSGLMLQVQDEPVMAFVLALLALPGVSVWITSVLRKYAENVNPRVIVYGVSATLTGIIAFTAGSAVPVFGGDPVTYVAAWQTWMAVNAETARRIYEALQPILWPKTT